MISSTPSIYTIFIIGKENEEQPTIDLKRCYTSQNFVSYQD